MRCKTNKMLWDFQCKKLIDNYEWELACFKWLLANTDGIEAFRNYPLIMPTRHFFPSTFADKPNQAELLFDIVKKHADMADWPDKLRAGKRDKPN